jgi:hypothetical protein
MKGVLGKAYDQVQIVTRIYHQGIFYFTGT